MKTSTLAPGAAAPDDVPLSADYAALLASPRVNARLREALEDRRRPADGPGALAPSELAILRAIVSRVLPRPSGAADLAARIDARLASGAGDGWRYEILPPDAEAYRRALKTLDAVATRRTGRGLADLPGEEIDALLRSVDQTSCGREGSEATPEALGRWFEDLRADAVRAYMALPSTLDRIGFSGIGAGGDGAALTGFTAFGVGIEEAWEPTALAAEVHS